jgi:hypothetical protein
MAVIDRDGRVFGRFNLVDTLLVLIVVAALPAAYAAHLLFRDPEARLVRVSPGAIEQGSSRLIEINGEHFRPYMRVSFGDRQAPGFQFYGPTQAFVPLPELEPGSYDVVLYDYTREVGRLPQAFTVSGPLRPPAIALRVRGAYINVTSEQAAMLAAGRGMDATEGMVATIEAREATRPSIARVKVSETLSVSVPMTESLEAPATLIVRCQTTVAPGGSLRCATGGVMLSPDMHISFQGPFGLVLFRIDAIEPMESGQAVTR